MALAIDFPGSNLTLGPPQGMTEDEVYSMRVFRGNNHIVSCWKLTDEEWAEVIATKEVWLSLMGNGAQPSFVGSVTSVLDLVFRDEEASTES